MRSETEAFISGFKFALMGVDECVQLTEEQKYELILLATQLANEMYPEFDEFPPPVKRSDDGNRKDGLVMT